MGIGNPFERKLTKINKNYNFFNNFCNFLKDLKGKQGKNHVLTVGIAHTHRAYSGHHTGVCRLCGHQHTKLGLQKINKNYNFFGIFGDLIGKST